MSRIIVFLMVLIVLISCKQDQKVNAEIVKINIDFKVDRFEQKFYTASELDLVSLKEEFPFLFPQSVKDTVWIQKMNNEQEQFLFDESEKVFDNFDVTKDELKSLFQHVKYQHPKFKEPNVITHISNLDYQYPVIYADSLLFISLDMYLGKDNDVYNDFPKYLSQNFIKERLIIDVSDEINDRLNLKLKSRTFLDKMINEGKYLYILDLNLSNTSDFLKIGYTKEKLDWAAQNEVDIWKYFIENELLFSNDTKLNSRFIDIAPFSKFYQQSDNDSPGRIGVWIGWRIVRSYMRNNDVTLQQLMVTQPENIFRKSKYKPRK